MTTSNDQRDRRLTEKEDDIPMKESDTVQRSTPHKRLVAADSDTDDMPRWFEALYQSAQLQEEVIPWARSGGNPLLHEWLARNHCSGDGGKRALVAGCGLGDDAEAVARRGFAVTAFDVAPAAIQWCRQRFPTSSVCYTVGDVLALPESWTERFDLIVEAFTLQVLPVDAQREAAAAQLVRCVAPGGSLLVICHERAAEVPKPHQMPWPLTRSDLQMFERLGLRAITCEKLPGARPMSPPYLRALYQK